MLFAKHNGRIKVWSGSFFSERLTAMDRYYYYYYYFKSIHTQTNSKNNNSNTSSVNARWSLFTRSFYGFHFYERKKKQLRVGTRGIRQLLCSFPHLHFRNTSPFCLFVSHSCFSFSGYYFQLLLSF
uniref:Uncharacterized protein n=1 Tax=Trypanosoma vivax (strain Y486) TaxID=1055687 RepID=G0TXN3_TRYVY|nr:hypothetical protein TVY486_0700670 [Trypanosoma vivax Y486]